MAQRIRKAVFPVGGLGTRFLPATKSIPKEMLPIVDQPLIQYVVEEAQATGIEEFIFVTGRGKSVIEDHFDYSYELDSTLHKRKKHDCLASIRAPILEPGQIVYTRQQEPMGLGHAIWCARHLIGNEPFAILLADDFIMDGPPCLRQMMGIYEAAETSINILATQIVPDKETHKYGILDVSSYDNKVVSARTVVEKPLTDSPSNVAVVGRYILQPTVLNHLAQQHKQTGEIELTDAIAQDTHRKVPLKGYMFSGRRFDCGSRSGFITANVAAALDRDELSVDVRGLLEKMISGPK